MSQGLDSVLTAVLFVTISGLHLPELQTYRSGGAGVSGLSPAASAEHVQSMSLRLGTEYVLLQVNVACIQLSAVLTGS